MVEGVKEAAAGTVVRVGMGGWEEEVATQRTERAERARREEMGAMVGTGAMGPPVAKAGMGGAEGRAATAERSSRGSPVANPFSATSARTSHSSALPGKGATEVEEVRAVPRVPEGDEGSMARAARAAAEEGARRPARTERRARTERTARMEIRVGPLERAAVMGRAVQWGDRGRRRGDRPTCPRVPKRARLIACFVAWALDFACSSAIRVSDVRRMGQQGDRAELLDAWEKAESDAVRIAVLDEITKRPEEAAGRALVLREAGRAATEPVKIALVRALGAYRDSAAMAGLIDALRDPWPAVREVAQAELAGRAEAIEPELRRALVSSPSHLVRAACARLLQGVALEDGVQRDAVEGALLDRALRDEAPRVREVAAAALGSRNVARARSALIELMRTDPDAGVRMSAERALQKLGDNGSSSIIVAVLPLRNDTGLEQGEIGRLGAQIAEYVAARLSSSKVCQVVDRERLETAIAEMRKVGAPLYDGDSPNAPEIGRFKIANQLVYGSIQRQGSIFTIVLNRIEVSTLGQVPGAGVTVRGYRADLEQLKERAADELIASFR